MKSEPRDDHLGVLLTAYADGSLHEDGCRFIEQQLEEHPELRHRLGEIGAAQETLRASLPPAPERLDEPHRQALMRYAARRPVRASRRWLLIASAAVFMLAVAGALLTIGPIVYSVRDLSAPMYEVPPVRVTSIPVPDTAAETAEESGFGGMEANRADRGGRPGGAARDADKSDGKEDSELDGIASFPGPPLELAKAKTDRNTLDESYRSRFKEGGARDVAATPKGEAKALREQAGPGYAGGKAVNAPSEPAAPSPAATPAPASAPPPSPIVAQRRIEAEKKLADRAERSTPGKDLARSVDQAKQAQQAAQEPGWLGASSGSVYTRQRLEDRKSKAEGKGAYLMAPERPALNFTPQTQADLNGRLAEGAAMQALERLSSSDGTIPLADGLLDLLGLPNDGDAQAVPFRLLVDPERPVREVFSQVRASPGQSVLQLATRNALQVVPMPGGFAVQAAGRPLDPTSTFGWPREDLRAAFGSAPMQAAAVDAQQTFAIDASTSSFIVARAALLRNELPDPGQIEPQHLYNAVPADYPAAAGEDAFQILAEAGPAPFASGPLAARTALVAIGVVSRPAGADERMPLDLVVALDTSGSMGRPGGLQRAQDGLDALFTRLDARDRVAVVAFGDVARIVQPAVRGDQRNLLRPALIGVKAAGSTNLADGLALACQVAGELATPGRACRVLLITDGAALAGDAAPAAEAAVARWRGRGVSLLVVGCADEAYDGAALERLAQQGDGEHLVATSDAQAVELFTVRLLPERLAILARDAKAQVTWNPERVAFARLIGFEKRRLTAEQFRDDRVDAGELGQDAHATALFEIVLTEHGSGPLGTAAVRYHDTRLGRVVELSRPLPGGLVASTASPRLRLLACAAELGETMQCGWWRNVRGPDGGRLASELARLDTPFSRMLAEMEQRYRALERQGQP